MERLRVESLGERFDLFGREGMAADQDLVADLDVLEIFHPAMIPLVVPEAAPDRGPGQAPRLSGTHDPQFLRLRTTCGHGSPVRWDEPPIGAQPSCAALPSGSRRAS